MQWRWLWLAQELQQPFPHLMQLLPDALTRVRQRGRGGLSQNMSGHQQVFVLFFRLLFNLALCIHIVRTPPLATTYLAIGFPLLPPLGLYSATHLCVQFLFTKSPFSKCLDLAQSVPRRTRSLRRA